MLLWLSGTLILGIWLLLRLHSVAGRHAYRAAAASLPPSFYNHLAGCAARLGLRRIPRVAVTRRLTSPAVFGVLSPVLLMPKGYLSKLSRRDTEHMLLHELAHIKRGDLVMHGLYLLLQIVYWYNPLLWLVRRQVHHLRELSCDGTVAELLRERTAAYRQTLLETARRLLATSAEPGLGLLGLFEDSNRLLVRLDWLTKPTWRYKTMKRVIVATIAVLMFACVLPMVQAREPVSHERRPPVVQEQDQALQDELSQDIAALEARLEELKIQQRQLQEQLRALAEKREQVRPSRQAPRLSRERTPEHVQVVRPESRSGPGGGRVASEPMPPKRQAVPAAPPQTPEEMEGVKREMVEIKEAIGRAEREGRRQEAAELRQHASQLMRRFQPLPPAPRLEERQEIKRQIEHLREEARRAKEQDRFEHSERVWQEADRLEQKLRESAYDPPGSREAQRQEVKRKIERVRQESRQAKDQGRFEDAERLWKEADRIEQSLREKDEILARQVREQKKPDVKQPGPPYKDEIMGAMQELKREIGRLWQALHEMRNRPGQ